MKFLSLPLAIFTLTGAALPAPDAAKDVGFASRIVAIHNAARAEVGTPPLTWSDTLAKSAQKWANEMAARQQFEHATQSAEGENLWMGTKASYSYEEMVQSWIDEKQDFKRGKFPAVTRTGTWLDVGHYTQLIWGNTTKVGCAIASSAGDDYLVCRYDPPGNWDGEDPIRPRRF